MSIHPANENNTPKPFNLWLSSSKVQALLFYIEEKGKSSFHITFRLPKRLVVTVKHYKNVCSFMKKNSPSNIISTAKHVMYLLLLYPLSTMGFAKSRPAAQRPAAHGPRRPSGPGARRPIGPRPIGPRPTARDGPAARRPSSPVAQSWFSSFFVQR